MCFQIMDMSALREDYWREASEDRARDEAVKQAVAAVQAGLEAVLRAEASEEARDVADLPWTWLERVVLLGGLAVSGWLAKGGLQRLWQRCCRPSEAEPVLPLQQQQPGAPPQQAVEPPPYHQAAAKLWQHHQAQPQDPAYWA